MKVGGVGWGLCEDVGETVRVMKVQVHICSEASALVGKM